MDKGKLTAAKLIAARKVPSPLPSSTETSLESRLAVARSSLPSPSKSPEATEFGWLPAGKLIAARKVPSPFPSSAETLEWRLATARPCAPSPLKSLTVTELGLVPAAKSLRATNDTVWATAGAAIADQSTNAGATSDQGLARCLAIRVLPPCVMAVSPPSCRPQIQAQGLGRESEDIIGSFGQRPIAGSSATDDTVGP